MRARIRSVEWAKEGAPPDAIVEAFGEAALTVAVLEALLADPDLRSKGLAAMKARPSEPTAQESVLKR